MTKIMIGLVNSLASNRHQAIDEDQGCFMDHQVCYLALFSWVYDMHELMTHPDWTFTGSYSLPGTMPLALSAWPWQKAQMDLQIKFWWVLFQERKPNFLRSYHLHKNKDSIGGLAQDCCNSHELTMELLLSCCDPSIDSIKYEHILLCCVFILVLP